MGFLDGLGQGLSGMGRSLADRVARQQSERIRKEERQLAQDNWIKEQTFRETEAGKRGAHEDASLKLQQDAATRQQDAAEQELVFKVLQGISGPTAVDKGLADKGRKHNMGSYFKDQGSSMILNPVTGMPMMGGAKTPEATIASPMINPMQQAQIDNLSGSRDLREQTIAQGADRLNMQQQLGEARNANQLAAITAANERAEATRVANALRDANDAQGKQFALEARIRHEVTQETMAAFPTALLDPSGPEARQMWQLIDQRTKERLQQGGAPPAPAAAGAPIMPKSTLFNR